MEQEKTVQVTETLLWPVSRQRAVSDMRNVRHKRALVLADTCPSFHNSGSWLCWGNM
jgi:hypothetical protein